MYATTDGKHLTLSMCWACRCLGAWASALAAVGWPWARVGFFLTTWHQQCPAVNSGSYYKDRMHLPRPPRGFWIELGNPKSGKLNRIMGVCAYCFTRFLYLLFFRKESSPFQWRASSPGWVEGPHPALLRAWRHGLSPQLPARPL